MPGGLAQLEAAELVARLDEYRRLDVRPGAADFAQALLRVRRDDRTALAAAAVAARELGTTEGERLAARLMTDVPSPPHRCTRTDEPRILVEFGELPEFRS
ncbi:hypothetical protein [Streptomyces tailanensis]|uniref:hypothetical protein n=1 Tax=Streptomyces tailanensis TaxID=2569858 RepID=UPI001FEC16F2|nr:hypothetical protein [Streptomyces tailanensis]